MHHTLAELNHQILVMEELFNATDDILLREIYGEELRRLESLVDNGFYYKTEVERVKETGTY